MTPLLLIAAAVLGAAGALKLRSQDAAMHALRELGLPAGRWVVRALALAELGLALWCALHPSRTATAALAALFAVFAGVALLLARRGSACGCFGEDDVPASIVQSLISGALAAIAIAATIAPAHGMAWVLGRPAGDAAVLIAGVLGAAYAAVLAHTELPRAWGSWSAR